MAGLNSWLSPAVMHALGWALIHSLWQCAAAAALAALAMAFVRRPAVRYLIGVGALALMLAAPLATFLVLARPVAPVQALHPATASLLPALSTAYPVAVFAGADRAIGAMRQAPRPFALPDILPWLVAAWSCGVAVFSLRFAGGFLLLEHRRRTQSQIPGARVLALCQALQRQLGLDRAIQYLECGWVEAPAVIGWLRPAVLLPVFALTGLSEEQFKAVIAHELAHIRRHDWLVNLFQVLVETLLFYHPAMWWLNRRIRIERELCCDEIAVSLTGSRLEYARALAQMAEWKNVSMLAMAANRGPLTQRILHVLGRKPSGAGQRVAGLTGGVLFLTAALAAANLLFGITYPIPAKAEIRAVLVSSQSVALRMARHVFPVSEPAVKIASPQIAAPDKVEAASGSQPENLTAPAPDLSRLMPNQSLATPTVVASNASPPIQTPANDAAVSHDPVKITRCGNTSVFGRVLSPNAVEMQGFYCVLSGAIGNNGIQSGSCPLASTYSYPSDPSGPFARDPSRTYLGDMVGPLNRLKEKGTECAFDIQMNVRLADPADAAKMKPGRMVRLAGNFQITRQDNTDYLSVTDARVTWADPFNRQITANDPAKIFHCHNTSAFGRVLSPDVIEMQGFTCSLTASDAHDAINAPTIQFGSCPAASSYQSAPQIRCKFDVTMNVRLANPADAAKMQPGKMVRVAGEFQVTRGNNPDYLFVTDARITWTDPFDRHATNASPAVTLNDQPVGPPTTRDPSVGPAQAGLSAQPATLPNFDPNKPYDKTRCTRVPNNTVMGRVASSTTIQMPRFTCGSYYQLPIYFGRGPCKSPVGTITSLPWGRYCPPLLTMTVQFANPADASKMPLGRLVTLKGDFLLITQNKVQYLLVQNARVLYVDPFVRHAEAKQPPQVAPAAPNSEPAAFTPHTVQAPVISAVNVSTNAPAAGPQTVTPCRNSSVFGRVMSPTAIEMQGFACFTDANGNGTSLGPRDIALGGCPLASTTEAHKTGCVWDVTLNVRLADKGDAAKMQPGKLVRLGGNFSVVRKGQAPYLVLENGKVLFVDFFWTGRSQAAGDIPPFYTGGVGASMSAGNSASGDPFGQIHGIGN